MCWQFSSYLPTLGILYQFKVIPGFLIQVYIFHLIAISINLGYNLYEAIFVGKYCWDSVTNSAAVIIRRGDTENLSKLSPC